jgi:hypothetical protein
LAGKKSADNNKSMDNNVAKEWKRSTMCAKSGDSTVADLANDANRCKNVGLVLATEGASSNESEPTPAKAALMKKKGKQWGPVQSMRQSNRIVHDGKIMIARAVELMQQKNLEKPKGTTKHTFATICNQSLVQKAISINVSLGTSSPNIHRNIAKMKQIESIAKMKQIESDRMDKLFDNQPDIFLPANIDLTLEDLMENNHDDDALESGLVAGNDNFGSLESPCHTRRSGRGENKPKNNKIDD